MFLKRVWQESRIDAIIYGVIFLVYLLLHVFRFELFPLQLFPMYSDHVPAPEKLHFYKVYDGEKAYELKSLPHRRYIYLNNTIGRYEQIVYNGEIDELEVIDKFFTRLPLADSPLFSSVRSSFEVKGAEDKMKRWLKDFLSLQKDPTVFRIDYLYNNGEIMVQDSTKILGS